MKEDTGKRKRNRALALACGLVLCLAACVFYFGPCFTVEGTYSRDLGKGFTDTFELKDGFYLYDDREPWRYRINYFTRTVYVEIPTGIVGDFPLRLHWGKLYMPSLKGGWLEYKKT